MQNTECQSFALLKNGYSKLHRPDCHLRTESDTSRVPEGDMGAHRNFSQEGQKTHFNTMITVNNILSRFSNLLWNIGICIFLGGSVLPSRPNVRAPIEGRRSWGQNSLYLPRTLCSMILAVSMDVIDMTSCIWKRKFFIVRVISLAPSGDTDDPCESMETSVRSEGNNSECGTSE